MASSDVTAKVAKLELIIEDDELLSSFCARWESPRGYIAIARATPERELYCELNGQQNGFRSKTIAYALDGKALRFSVADDESFLRDRKVKAVELELPRGSRLARVKACLDAVFAAPPSG